LKRCALCGATAHSIPIDRHHIKRRKAGGSDHPTNTIFLCRPHHQEIHATALTEFVLKYPQMKQELLDRQWEFEELRKKWFMPHGHPGR